MLKYHSVVAVARGSGRKHQVLYHDVDQVKAGQVYEKAILDPKWEEVGISLNIGYLRTCCPRAQAENSAAAQEVPDAPEKAEKPEKAETTVTEPKKSK